MKDSKPNRLQKRIFNSWFTSLISMTLVLVMIGMLGLLLLNASKLSEYVREKIGFTLVLNDDVKEVEVDRLQKVLNSGDFVKSTRYIDKETAAKELTAELGEDFTSFLGYNPLFASIEVKLFAKYTHPDSLLVLKKVFLDYPQIKDVYYQKSLLTVINKNLKRISLIILIISGLLAFIFVALINNTIRISIYSQRFTINTMQMVGATNGYIRKPFLLRSLYMGIFGGLTANVLLAFLILTYKKELEGILSTADLAILGIVFLVVLVLGLIISVLSTYFAVNKFLRLKFDELFY